MAGASVSTKSPVISTGTRPLGFKPRYSGVRVDPLVVETKESEKGRPISSNTMCGASEHAPGE